MLMKIQLIRSQESSCIFGSMQRVAFHSAFPPVVVRTCVPANKLKGFSIEL